MVGRMNTIKLVLVRLRLALGAEQPAQPRHVAKPRHPLRACLPLIIVEQPAQRQHISPSFDDDGRGFDLALVEDEVADWRWRRPARPRSS
jgi:hypothetical protein